MIIELQLLFKICKYKETKFTIYHLFIYISSKENERFDEISRLEISQSNMWNCSIRRHDDSTITTIVHVNEKSISISMQFMMLSSW
jgi:hypothetical protein